MVLQRLVLPDSAGIGGWQVSRGGEDKQVDAHHVEAIGRLHSAGMKNRAADMARLAAVGKFGDRQRNSAQEACGSFVASHRIAESRQPLIFLSPAVPRGV